MSRDLLRPPQVHVVGPTPSPTPSPRASPAPGSGYRSISASPNRSRRSTISSQGTLFADEGLKPPIGSPYQTSTTPVSPAWTYGASAGTSPASVFPLLDDCGHGSPVNGPPTAQLCMLCYDLQHPAKQNQASGNAFWHDQMSMWAADQPFCWEGESASLDHKVHHDRLHPQRSRAVPALNVSTVDACSSGDSSHDVNDTFAASIQDLWRYATPNSVNDRTARASLVCLGPQCHPGSFPSEGHLKAHVRAVHTHSCNWAGCQRLSFACRAGLVWHVKSEHLFICPVPGCTEASFEDVRTVSAHVVVAHPEMGNHGVKEWQLEAPTAVEVVRNSLSAQLNRSSGKELDGCNEDGAINEMLAVAIAKRKCHDQLRTVVEKKAKKNSAGTPRNADSPTDLIRARASKLIDTASFPLIFEHAVLPFLAEFLPKWTSPKHVINVARGRTSQARRLCIMTSTKISRARKIIIAGHVGDLLPEKFRWSVSFVFSVGEVVRSRSRCWAKGLGGGHLDDICHARNPYHFRHPSMGDSIGIRGNGDIEEATATLGPSLTVDGGSYWLANFHPFLEAYQSMSEVAIEHPSPQDRAHCIQEGHDVLDSASDFTIGHVRATSGLNLRTTRVSHDAYWDENLLDKPLVTMDWVLIGASQASRGANMLRRFPSETQAPLQEPLVRSVSTRGTPGGVVPGAAVVSSGRTSGYQRGLVCEVPAYVSAASNGTGKPTREWFVEEPPGGNEDDWIRGGIGVEGDSGGAIVDAETHCLMGQLWGRNKYAGPGPRFTWFAPITDILDDVQEKCGTDGRPQLPQHCDEADRYPVYPSCRQCYDAKIYLDTRRSSRVSFQSMMMIGAGDGDQDLISVEAVSELATPRDYHRHTGIEEIGSSFRGVGVWSPADSRISPGTPVIGAGDIKSLYSQTLELDDSIDSRISCCEPAVSRKRPLLFQEAVDTEGNGESSKRKRTEW
ncbi:putative DNA polymerase epsilon, calytic chain POL2 [Drechmeria coniospora]|uniref:Putative DNA polymerase epsilon, calytic chain POL2 n=1 Tax=Drechmeria coniospora TaxID=98403 RepID=A0A151GCM1_DRECN|nr:putative DNA polymerase epsilon, calytic chain POL2 [Drechmeria coniospora]KYK54846.1 putative DNA polymerase epsilon, calytic chain POL2 [Drechmeria coniospora]